MCLRVRGSAAESPQVVVMTSARRRRPTLPFPADNNNTSLLPPTHGGQRMGGGDLIPVWRGAAHEEVDGGSVSSGNLRRHLLLRHRPAFQSPVGQQLLSRHLVSEMKQQ